MIRIQITYLLVIIFYFFPCHLNAQDTHSVLNNFDTIKSTLVPEKIKSFIPKIEAYQAIDVKAEQIEDMLIYNYSEANNMPANFVSEIVRDKEGFLWLATNKGLLKFDGNTFYKIVLPDSLASAEVRSLVIDKTGAIWFSVFESALLKYDKGKIYVMNELAIDFEIRKIFVSSDSTIWLGCDNGFCNFKNNSIIKYHYNQVKAGTDYYYTVINFSEDYQKNVWVSAFGNNIIIIGKNNTLELAIDNSPQADVHYARSKVCKIIHFKNGKTLIVGRNLQIYIVENFNIIERHGYNSFFEKTKTTSPVLTDITFWNNNILVSSSGGLFKSNKTYDSCRFILSPFLFGIRCSDLLISDNMLFVSKSNGFCIVQNPKTKKEIIPNGTINSIKIDSEKIYLACNNYCLYDFIDSLRLLKECPEVKATGRKMDLSDISNKFISLIGKNNIFYLIDKNNFQIIAKYSSTNVLTKEFMPILPRGVVNKTIIINDSIIATFGFEAIALVNVNNHTIQHQTYIPYDINDAEKALNKNNIIFSTNKIIYSFDIKSYKVTELFKINTGIINSFTLDKDYIWACTSKGIIYRIELANTAKVKSFYSQTIEKYLNKGIKIIRDKIFLITNGGLYYFPYSDFDTEKLSIYKLKINSLGEDNIGEYNIAYIAKSNKFFYTLNNQLYIGFYSELFDNDSINTYLSKVYVSNKEYNNGNFYFPHSTITLPHDSSDIKIFISALTNNLSKIDHYKFKLEGYDNNWTTIYQSNYIQYTKLPPGKYILKYKAVSETGFESTEKSFTINILYPFWRTYWFYSLCFIIVVIFIYLIIKIRERRFKQETILLEKKIKERTIQISKQKNEIEKKKNVITESIEYAKNIQKDILSNEKLISAFSNNYFVFHKPKDIVSGDFYWVYKKDDKHLLAVIDCVGHGVSGAFVSLIANMFLNEIIQENNNLNPAQILSILNNKIINLQKSNLHTEEIKYGLDISIISLNKTTQQLEYAGARNPLLIIRNREMHYFDGDKKSIINTENTPSFEFTNHKFQLQTGDMLYLYTDGYSDQIGGTDRKKMFSKTFKVLLQSISVLDIHEQKNTLKKVLKDWMNDLPQTDDILIIGVKI